MAARSVLNLVRKNTQLLYKRIASTQLQTISGGVHTLALNGLFRKHLLKIALGAGLGLSGIVANSHLGILGTVIEKEVFVVGKDLVEKEEEIKKIVDIILEKAIDVVEESTFSEKRADTIFSSTIGILYDTSIIFKNVKDVTEEMLEVFQDIKKVVELTHVVLAMLPVIALYFIKKNGSPLKLIQKTVRKKSIKEELKDLGDKLEKLEVQLYRIKKMEKEAEHLRKGRNGKKEEYNDKENFGRIRKEYKEAEKAHTKVEKELEKMIGGVKKLMNKAQKVEKLKIETVSENTTSIEEEIKHFELERI